jgi:uncharacterized phage infection (PIP) family protein YhgE
MTVLQEAVKAVHESVQGVKQGVESLQSVAGNLHLMLASAPATLEKMNDLYVKHADRLQELSSAISAIQQASTETIQKLGATAGQLSTVLKDFQALPEQLRQQLAASVAEQLAGSVEQLARLLSQFEGLPASLKESVRAGQEEVKLQLPKIWEDAAKGLREKIDNLIEGIKGPSDEALEKLGKAAGSLNDTAQAAGRLMMESFEKATENVTRLVLEKVPRVQDFLFNQLPRVQEETENLVKDFRELVAEMDAAGKQMSELLSRIPIATPAPTGISMDLEPLLRSVRLCSEELSRVAHMIDRRDGKCVLSSLSNLEQSLVTQMGELMKRIEDLRRHTGWRMYI